MRVWSWRRRLAVITFLVVVAGLAAVAIWQFERHGIPGLFVAGLGLIVIGAATTILHWTASDDFLRRQFGESGVAQRRRARRSAVISMLLGALMVGLPIGFSYFEHRAAEALTRRGNARIQSGEYALAIEDFNKALELDPNSADAYHGRGLAHLHLGEQDRAIADL